MEAYVFYNAPIGIFAKFGITQDALIDFLRFHVVYYMIEFEMTFTEACEDLGIKGWDEGEEEECREVYEYYKHRKVKTSIRSDQFWQLFNNVESESDYSKLLLLLFLAVKSIVGRKNYTTTNYDFLLARMAGDSEPRFVTQKGEKVLILPAHLKPFYKKRRKLERLREDLRRFHVATWSLPGMHGFAISTKLTEEQLAIELATNGPKSQAHLQRARKERVKAVVKRMQAQQGNIEDVAVIVEPEGQNEIQGPPGQEWLKGVFGQDKDPF